MTAAAPSLTSPWIVGRGPDLLLFVLTPLLILPAAMLLQQGLASQTIQYGVLAFGAMGHNLPGMMRAYGDRALFRRFRTRFLVAPIALYAACLAFTLRGSSGMLLLAYGWAIWHALMQVYGFLRIYDARAGGTAPRFCRIDLAMCAVWFFGAVLFSDTRMHVVLGFVQELGVPPPTAGALAVARQAFVGAIAAVTLLYLHSLWARRNAGIAISMPKQLLYLSSIGFWWYVHVFTTDVLLGLVLFEVFHDVQYLAIVWLFNRRRVTADPQVGGFTRFLFRRSWGLLALYVGLCLAYGGFLPLSQQWHGSDLLTAALASVVMTSALLHYYFDGFLWKVREHDTRTGLGLQAQAGATTPRIPRHGLKWLALVVPAAVMWSLGVHRIDLPAAERLAEVTPGAAQAHFDLGVRLNEVARHQESLPSLERALQLRPGDAEFATNLALARLEAGKALLRARDPGAAPLLRAAFQGLPPLLQHCLQEGERLGQGGELREAAVHFRAALAMRDDVGPAHLGLAMALSGLGDPAARSHAERAAGLMPGDPRPAALLRQIQAR